MVKPLVYPEEHNLYLICNDKDAVKLICTKEHIPELIYGYLFSEGIIENAEDVISKTFNEDESYARLVLADSVSKDNVHSYNRIARYSVEELLLYANEMDNNMKLYAQTGGMHCSSLFHKGKMLAMYEDISRRNTIDKLAGYCLLHKISISEGVLITTGRISEDMVYKAAKLGVSIIASYSTPTRQACETAENMDISIIRYLQKTGEVCTAKDRIYLSDPV